MKHDSKVLKEFLKAQPGEEFGVCIPDKESVQVRNYGIVRKIGEESMHDVIISLHKDQVHLVLLLEMFIRKGQVVLRLCMCCSTVFVQSLLQSV